MAPRKTDPVVRFWSKVDKSAGEQACWIWTGTTLRGYGSFRLGQKEGCIRAHRMSYELMRGRIPEGMCVCHACDIRLCVNPQHLFIGTHSDNVADMVRKGRVARGERQACAKLTVDAVRTIRGVDLPGYVFAKQYGVSATAVSSVRRGKTWRHV